MEWKDSLRHIQATEKITGEQLLRRFAGRNHNSPNVPHYAYDGNGIMPIIRRLTAAERVEFGIQNGPPATPVPPASAFGAAAPPTPVFTIRVHVICAADDDGGNAFADPSTVKGWMAGSLDEANAIYDAHSAGIRLTFDAGDIELLKSTLVNQDFTVPAGTNMKTSKDQKPLSDDQIKQLGVPHEAERNRICQKYRDRCVLLLCSGTDLAYDDTKQIWDVIPRAGYAYSTGDIYFINFPAVWGTLHGPELAHESGHYFNLWHTHGPRPATIAEAAKDILDYVNNSAGGDASRGLEVFRWRSWVGRERYPA